MEQIGRRLYAKEGNVAVSGAPVWNPRRVGPVHRPSAPRIGCAPAPANRCAAATSAVHPDFTCAAPRSGRYSLCLRSIVDAQVALHAAEENLEHILEMLADGLEGFLKLFS